jgi:predicted RNA-binding Zn-ribbon protein involved in translation (DUF1610 family)
MSLLFRPSEHDRESLRATVRSLRETTVAGLAAALSWRVRKVERLLVEELTRPGTSMAYDPARRVVRWTSPIAVAWSHPPPSLGGDSADERGVDLGPALSAPPPVVRSGGLRAECPSCHLPLVGSTSPSLSVCPQCGRLFASRTATGATEPRPEPRASSPASAATSNASPYGDRRSQELLAAYVTARPIPCPRCKTHLRHRGVSEYVCPSCGETVRFGPTGVAPAGPSPRAGPASQA